MYYIIYFTQKLLLLSDTLYYERVVGSLSAAISKEMKYIVQCFKRFKAQMTMKS